LEKETRRAIFNIYGFVRFADEIVDTFHDYDKKYLLSQFEKDYYTALEKGISLNPVLHSFQQTVFRYGIEDAHVQAFLSSMKSDLETETYAEKEDIDRYIFGSADVVGLMCLKVFCRGDQQLYRELLEPAMKLGSAFQKVNFLRDLKNDMQLLGRRYFPELLDGELDDTKKHDIVHQIREDFRAAFTGLRKLPGRSRLAVYTAYLYYLGLLAKINNTPARKIMVTRIRIPDWKKMLLMVRAVIAYKLKLI
jgi:phytoene/squalene synthetase